ncbi:MAG: arsenate reductase ArsC [Gammaproteobacteria bacterium]|nr:arsenate reductase ArsC [Gammaproteobacteria bacterium]
MRLQKKYHAAVLNVLFLCTGNSARSILAEAILNHLGDGRFCGYSAGSHPAGKVNPFAIELLQQRGLVTDALRSKSWDEFSGAGAPSIDFVFTVCDNAAAESCPLWAGRPATAHWGIPDPAAVAGTDAEKRVAFADAYRMLVNRIEKFVNLPIDSMDVNSLQDHLSEIGRERI